tara:strand:+ start:11420 stop:11827 length:408 start_codon:yes stop_codon:yes gene_type:complete
VRRLQNEDQQNETMNIEITDDNYAGFVASRLKHPGAICRGMTVERASLTHIQMGISGEAGEITDAIKKHVCYGQPLDRANIIEELGDLEFYLMALREEIGVTRQETLSANVEKLSTRYKSGYTDQEAKNRNDKKA